MERINCTIFIDGKLPGLSVLNGYFLSKNDTEKEIQIQFKYVIGEIQMTKENSNLINSLAPNDDLTICLSYRDEKGRKFNYSEVLKVEWLRYRYLVIRITNLNKKRKEYYFGYSTPGVIKKFIKKEYKMFEYP